MKICPNPDCPELEVFGRPGEYRDELTFCATCGTRLEWARAPESHTEELPQVRDLVPLAAPNTSSELAIMQSLLEAEGIPYLIHNEHFGAMKIGPSIPLFNQRTLMVPEEDLERAREILTPPADEPDGSECESSAPEAPGAPWDGLRMLVELLFFGWIIPRRGTGRWNG